MKYLFLIILIFLSCNQDIKFDSEEWKRAGGEEITLNTRLNMSNDLIRNKILLNKNEIEIIELIGSPSKLNNQVQKNIKYFPVKEIYGFDIDPKEMIFLKIKINKNGKSTSVDLFSTN